MTNDDSVTRAIAQLSRAVDIAYVDLLDLKAALLGSSLHDYDAAISILRRAQETAETTNDSGLKFRIRQNSAIPLVRLKRYAEARVELSNALKIATSGVPEYGAVKGNGDTGYITPLMHMRAQALGAATVGARNSAQAPDLVIPGRRGGGMIDRWRRS